MVTVVGLATRGCALAAIGCVSLPPPPADDGGTAGFAATVVLAGSGTGTVTSSPPGIDCGTDCTESFAAGTVVTLTATPGAGSKFSGWSGACTGATTCTFDVAATVSASFAEAPLQRLGEVTDLGGTAYNTAGRLIGQRVVTPAAYTLRKFGLIVRTAGPQVVHALYTDSGGAPGALVASSGIATTTMGVMETDPTVADVVLPAGTYWHFTVSDLNLYIGTSNPTTNTYLAWRDITFPSLPNPFGAPTTNPASVALNYYLVVQ